MLPYITIFGKDFPTYGLCAIVAAIVGWIVARLRLKQTELSKDDCDYGYIFAVIGVFIGAKLLSVITVLPSFIRDFGMLFSDPGEFVDRYLTTGFVFYGGLIGGIVAVWIYARWNKIPFTKYISALVPSIPIIHAIGRVGCFLTGCCYGIPHDSLGIVLHNSTIAPNDVPLLPVQLIEAGGNLIIAAVLLIYAKKKANPYKLLAVYMILYPIMRFILEYFRYDAYRGIVGGLSTSQWICIGAWVFAGILLYLARRKKSEPATETAPGPDNDQTEDTDAENEETESTDEK